MANANRILLTTGTKPEYYRDGISEAHVKKATELLQENHEIHHMFFNDRGFHNHIVHHLLAILAMRASPEELQAGYDHNTHYQRPHKRLDAPIVEHLRDPEKFKTFLGPEKYYPDFVQFYKEEIEKSSWQDVVQKYILAGDERADDMLVRMYASFLHPIIHLGYAIEFEQPLIVAEALAQASGHSNRIGDFLVPSEKAANERRRSQPSESIVSLLDELKADEKIQNSTKWEDNDKVNDGFLARAADRMVQITSKFHVNAADLEEKTAEMTNAAAWFTAGAQHPPNKVMFDFFLIHALNASIFFPTFLKQGWMSDANKVRLLEWKVRMDLALYVSQGSPEIRMDEIRNYKPLKPSGWDEIMTRICKHAGNDDGHAGKLVRALAHGQKICEPYEAKPEFRVKHDDWLQMGHMAIDSVEGTAGLGAHEAWVWSAGFEGAWETIPLRSQL